MDDWIDTDSTSSWIDSDSTSSVWRRLDTIEEETEELVRKYKEGEDPKGLDKAISKLQRAIQDEYDDIFVVDSCQTDLAKLLWDRHRDGKIRQPGDLDDAINKMEIALGEKAENEGYEGNDSGSMAILAQMLWDRYESSLDPNDMNDAVFRAERAVFMISEDEDDADWKKQYEELQDLLVSLLSKRFRRTNSLPDLDMAIEITEKVLQRVKEGGRKWVDLQQTSAKHWEARAQRTNDPEDANRAVKKARLVAERTKVKSPQWAERRAFLACTVWSHALMTRNVKEGAEAMSLLDSVISKSARRNLDNPSLGEQQAQLALMHWIQSLLSNNITGLGDAILRMQAALSVIDKEDPALEARKLDLQIMENSRELQARAPKQGEGPFMENDSKTHSRALLTAARALQQRFDRTKRTDNLNAAILLAELSIGQATSPSIDADERAHGLIALSRFRMQLFETTNSLDALEGAISAMELAVSQRPEEHSEGLEHAAALSTLASMRLALAKQTWDMNKLNQAIATAESGIVILEEGTIDWAKHQAKLASMLYLRYQWAGHKLDLDLAVHKLELAISAAPAEAVDRATFRVQISRLLFSLYEAEGNELHLDRAIIEGEKAVRVFDDEDPRSAYDALAFLAESLSRRFLDQPGRLRDLKDAIKIQKALIARDGTALNVIFSLARNLCSQYQLWGNLDDLETAVHRGGIARQQVQTSVGEYVEGLSKLAECLAVRFDSTGNTADLEEAISLTRTLLSTSPKDRNLHSFICRLLGFLLLRRYHTGNITDLDEAIENMRMAVVYATPASLSCKLAYFALADAQIAKYEASANAMGRAAAIACIQEAVASPIEPRNQQMQAYNAAYSAQLAHWRFEETGLNDDLDEAISNLSIFLSSPHMDRPKRAKYMEFLADLLVSRYSMAPDIKDQRKVIKLRCGISKMAGIAPLTRLRNARQGIRLLMERGARGDWQKALKLVKVGIRLLPEVVGRHLSHGDQETAVLSVSGFAADACSISLHMGHIPRALQQLELGRGLILGNMISSRTTLEELRAERLDLADRFEALRVKAFKEIRDYHPRIRQRKLQQRRKAESDYRRCIDEIRQNTSFKNFMADPTVQELQKQAAEGAIAIVNVTDISSDAIIVPPAGDKIKHIPLPGLISSAAIPRLVREQVEQYRDAQGRGIVDPGETKTSTEIGFLSYLWLNCVRDILNKIGCSPIANLSEQPQRRVWWIGSGVASSFPFHAAGLYDGFHWSSENTLAWCIPSYTPTIRALRYARTRASQAGPLKGGELEMLIVTMATTPGEDPLDGALSESNAVEAAIKPLCEDKEVRLLHQPSAQDVLSELHNTKIAHFACHGASDRRRPLQSHLLLQIDGPDGPSLDRLTAEAVASETILYASIAFLSACSTAENRAEAFADESLHLTNVFQIVGFPHVIGSQWTADDVICVEMARLFYGSLAEAIVAGYQNQSVAKALHSAMVELQAEYWRFPRLWAPYIHSGA
jgi:hypothetical protein